MSLYARAMPTTSVAFVGKKVEGSKGERMEEMPDILRSNVVNVLTGITITMAVYRSVNDDQQTC